MTKFQILERFPWTTIIHHIDEEETLWATNGRVVTRKTGERWEVFSRFPFAIPRDLFGGFRPSARIFRSDKCNLYRNRRGNLLGIRAGWVYRFLNNQPQKLFPINGDCALHGSICEDQEGNIYFGEYFMNPDRKPARIWRVNQDLQRWRPAASLEGTRHIHGVYPDPFIAGMFWVTVGDYAGECFLLKTDDAFRSFEKYGDGGQFWRAVRLFFTESHICWLTDSHIEQNFACRMARNKRELELGQPVDASTWYGCRTKEGEYLAFTTIERGPAIQTDQSSILYSTDAFHWQKIAFFKKDIWRPMQLFKYGVISCPSGEMSSEAVYLSGEGLVGFDGVSLKGRIIRDG